MVNVHEGVRPVAVRPSLVDQLYVSVSPSGSDEPPAVEVHGVRCLPGGGRGVITAVGDWFS